MIKERTYSATNKCLNRIKASNLDQMLKVRLECHFIRLKRHILSSPINLIIEDIATLEELSEEIIHAEQKEQAVASLETKIRQLISETSQYM